MLVCVVGAGGRVRFQGRDKGWLDPSVRPTEVRGHDFMVTRTPIAVSFQESRRWATG